MNNSKLRYLEFQINYWTTLVIVFLFFSGSNAWAVSTTGTMNATVVAALGITSVSALNFGAAGLNDPADVVAPGTVEDASNGSFNVTGQPSTAYQIQLPASANMITGAGGANRTIAVTAFTSFPASTGTLSAGGTQLLLVGATRAAIPSTQVLGSYTGTYTVTVIY